MQKIKTFSYQNIFIYSICLLSVTSQNKIKLVNNNKKKKSFPQFSQPYAQMHYNIAVHVLQELLVLFSLWMGEQK